MILLILFFFLLLPAAVLAWCLCRISKTTDEEIERILNSHAPHVAEEK